MRILDIGNLNRMGELYCKIFRELGHDADILTWHPSCKPPTEIKPIKIHGTKIVRELNLFKKLLELRGNYDLFICHYAFQSSIFANMLGLKYICHVRGHDITHNPKKPLIGKLVETAFRNAQAIWCSTPVLVALSEKYNKNTVWIPNIVKTDIYKPFRTKKDKNKIEIFMPARHTWEKKGNAVAVRLLKRILEVEPAELNFIEWGEDVKRTKQLVKKLGLEGNVVWHPHTLDERKMAQMYNSADAVWNSFGFTSDRLDLIALEAMSCNAGLIVLKLETGLYPTAPPVVQAENLDEVVEKTIKMKAPNKKQREWVVKYNSYDVIKRKIDISLNKIRN